MKIEGGTYHKISHPLRPIEMIAEENGDLKGWRRTDG